MVLCVFMTLKTYLFILSDTVIISGNLQALVKFCDFNYNSKYNFNNSSNA